MKAAKLRGPGHFEIVEEPIPSYGSKEVLIKVLTCGICSSEHGTWSSGSDHQKIYGHEIVGRIVEVGTEVKNYRPGDRVTGMIYGGFAEYTTAAEELLVKVPDNLSSLEAIAEPLSCIQTGIDRLDLEAGSPAAVIGCGYMGLLLIKLLRLADVNEIIAIDPRTEALRNAIAAGASCILKPDEVPDAWKIRDWNEISFERGIPLVCEVTGTQGGITLAGEMCALHGQLSVVGYHAGGLRTIDLGLWGWKALNVINTHERRDHKHLEAQARLLNSLADNRWDAESLYTHVYSLDKINQAFQDQAKKPDGYIKAALIIDKDEEKNVKREVKKDFSK